jgi:hypothetical protein
MPSVDVRSMRVIVPRNIRLVEISFPDLELLDQSSMYEDYPEEATPLPDWMREWLWDSHSRSSLETLIVNIDVGYHQRDCLHYPWRELDSLLRRDGVPSLKRTSIRITFSSTNSTVWQNTRRFITSSLPLMNDRGILTFSAVDVHGRALTLEAS